jgi:hypothetical protein
MVNEGQIPKANAGSDKTSQQVTPVSCQFKYPKTI